MLIEMFLFIETFLTVTALPFIYICMKLVLLLISVYVIVRVKPTPSWNMIFFFLHKGHQILQQRYISGEYTLISTGVICLYIF